MTIAIPTPLNVIIIGSGIAGSAAAIGLSHHRVTVLESSTFAGEIGAGIHMKPNAVACLKLLDVDMRSLRGVPCDYVWELDGSDKCFLRTDVHASQRYGSEWLLCHRHDLHNALRKKAYASQNVTLRTRCRVKAIEPEAGRVELDSGEVMEADVIICADGIRSGSRRIVAGPSAPLPLPSGTVTYRALVTRAKIMADPKLGFLLDGKETGQVLWYLGSDPRRIVLYPCRDLEMLNIVATFPDPDPDPAQEGGEYWGKGWKRTSSVEEMLATYPDFPDTPRRVLALAENVQLWQLREVEPFGPWNRGRALLIGDASHPVLPSEGQGGSLSVEDGEALRHLLPLGTAAADVPVLLKAYYDFKHPRVDFMQTFTKRGLVDAETGVRLTANRAASHVEHGGKMFLYKGAGSVQWRNISAAA